MDFSPTVLYSGIQAAEMHSCFLDTSVAKEMLQETTFSREIALSRKYHAFL